MCGFGLHAIPESLYEAKKLRTLHLLFPQGDLGELPFNLFSSFGCLQFLNLSGTGIKRLQESVSCLTSLTYLNFSSTFIETLRENICNLSELRVLNLSNCYYLIELPRQLACIYKLRHLMISGCDRLSDLPDNIGALMELQTLPVFIVGMGIHKSLRQLSALFLKGEPTIRRLENVISGDDAATASLSQKPNLSSLGLLWGNNDEDLVVAKDELCKVAEEVLECLQPHQHLKRLSIEGYPGTCFPRWIDAFKLPNITNIKLVKCQRCEQLPFLKVICMGGMHAVRVIGSEFYGGGSRRPFQSLEELFLRDFPNLEFWWSMNGREEIPSLVKLTIKNCPMLKNMPCFQSLQFLELRNCSEMILTSAANLSTLSNLLVDVFPGQLVLLECLLQNNPCLMSLTISSCPNLYSITSKLGCLTALKSLSIRWCEELLFLPQEIENRSLLEFLEVIECPNLPGLPEGIRGLSSLRSLSIENCSNVTCLPVGMQHLTSLEHLAIMYCPALISLPTDLGNLSKLQSLYVLSCPELASLPEGLQHVTSLQILEIYSCPGFMILPSWIGNLTSLRSLVISDCANIISLPEGMQHLTSLQYLSIQECPRLENRCKKCVGDDWLKISHIAHTCIGSPKHDQHNMTSSSYR